MSDVPDLGGPDLGDLFRQAQEMQAQMMEMQAAVAEQEVEGVAGGGAVRIVASGALEFRSVTISPGDEVFITFDIYLSTPAPEIL